MTDLPEEREHIDTMDCWCNPDIVFENEDGTKVIVHKGPGDELAPAWIIAEAIADVISGDAHDTD